MSIHKAKGGLPVVFMYMYTAQFSSLGCIVAFVINVSIGDHLVTNSQSSLFLWFLGDPDWLSEKQYNTISPLFVDS